MQIILEHSEINSIKGERLKKMLDDKEVALVKWAKKVKR